MEKVIETIRRITTEEIDIVEIDGKVKAIFYKGAVALLEKILEGWVLSYMYTFPERRRQGDMTYILEYLKHSYTIDAVPRNSIAEEVLQKAGFVVDIRRFGSPFYRMN